MSTEHNYFEDVSPRMKGKAERGTDIRIKHQLSQLPMPLYHVDKIIGISWRDFNPEDAYEYPTTVETPAGTKVHLHQNVREIDNEDAFGSFGAVEDDDDSDVIWTTVDLLDNTVTLTVVGDWGKRRDVPLDQFDDQYEPMYLSNGEPRWGY